MIFDNVFVPNERVFLDGETAHAATLAHSLGLWERAAGLGDAGESRRSRSRHGGAARRRERHGRRPAHQGSARDARRVRDDVPRRRRSGDGQRDEDRRRQHDAVAAVRQRAEVLQVRVPRAAARHSARHRRRSARERTDRRGLRTSGPARRPRGDVRRARLHAGRSAAPLPLRARHDGRCVWRLGVRHRATRRRRATRAAHRDDAPVQHGTREGHRAPRGRHRQVREKGRGQLDAPIAL